MRRRRDEVREASLWASLSFPQLRPHRIRRLARGSLNKPQELFNWPARDDLNVSHLIHWIE